MEEDVYEMGEKELTKTNVVAVRANLRRRLDEKIELRECIMHELTNKPAHAPINFQDESNRRPPSWQRALRQIDNNLNL